MLTFTGTDIILHAFISSRSDYCNSLFTCMSQKSIDPLQTVQNSAARFLTRTKKHDPITPVAPECFRIDFQILLITLGRSWPCSLLHR